MAGKDVAKRGVGVAPYTSERLPALSAEEVRSRVNLIQQVMKGVMKDGVHYGQIPGAGKKPMLFKPGAETLSVTFQLAHEYIVEDLSDGDSIRYRVTDRISSQATGTFICEGVGEASSNEEKYKWRKALCDAEFDEAAEDRRRLVWKKGLYENGRWNANKLNQVKQLRTQPPDIANTVLKMAKKRAQVDGVLTATGASDAFGQDMEDLPEELRTSVAEDVIDGEVVEDVVASEDTIEAMLKLAAGKDNGSGKPVSQKAILTNLKRQYGYEGELEEMTQAMAEATMEGLAQLDSLPTSASKGPRQSQQTGQNGDDSASGSAEASPRGANDKRLAKLCILWNDVIARDLDDEQALRGWIESTYGTAHRSELNDEQKGEVIEALEHALNPGGES